ncbi:hypothetical protein GCM10023142_20350 [Anaerocolumna aminovalerica]|jgi:hypothetical protein|uniref:Uncharacterized protein n=1 Tax=Anaerocolumna aminovalerica TaxID=1527 RepID=A0A1I5FSH0_9FIRM|nr:hypothetical protein [Anaerocolumna aminovalerica]MDU6265393.1 hypothetical protein [Anaerocolumna aminovalerica]SFO26533.1 hypothetical protein SAMN04489757_11590 [Anaerocolumna aminovalerica]
MNKKIGIISSIVNLCAVVGFALCMLLGSNFGSYFICMFIAFSFVPMICTLVVYSEPENKAAGYTAMIFAGIYAVLILLVYFAQVTVINLESLNEQALKILDFQKFGLFFNYDLLGYGLMALSTFFAGLTIESETKADKWLKALLLIHGVFFISCLIMPMLGLFTEDMQGADWIGVAVLEFWCIYFIPIDILMILHLKKKS